MYEFTNDCLIGIKEIDDEHAKLFKMINDAISMGNELDDIAPVANNLISGLKNYAATHFASMTLNLTYRKKNTLPLRKRLMSSVLIHHQRKQLKPHLTNVFHFLYAGYTIIYSVTI